MVSFQRLVPRNNADLGKGVPRQHVLHEAWELLFFCLQTLIVAKLAAHREHEETSTARYLLRYLSSYIFRNLRSEQYCSLLDQPSFIESRS